MNRPSLFRLSGACIVFTAAIAGMTVVSVAGAIAENGEPAACLPDNFKPLSVAVDWCDDREPYDPSLQVQEDSPSDVSEIDVDAIDNTTNAPFKFRQQCLFINDKRSRLYLRGVGYSPIEPSRRTLWQPFDRFTWHYEYLWRRDLPRIQAMKANTIRLWSWTPTEAHSHFLDFALRHSLYVLVPFEFTKAKYPSLGSPATRRQLVDDFTIFLRSTMHHRAVVAYLIGNELNREYDGQRDDLISAVNLLAHVRDHIDPVRHPMTLPLSDENFGTSWMAHYYNDLRIDFWSIQSYRRGKGLASAVDDYAQAVLLGAQNTIIKAASLGSSPQDIANRSAGYMPIRPLVFTEFGADALAPAPLAETQAATRSDLPRPQLNETMQAKTVSEMFLAIRSPGPVRFGLADAFKNGLIPAWFTRPGVIPNTSTYDTLVQGSLVMEWVDEWWKSNFTSADRLECPNAKAWQHTYCTAPSNTTVLYEEWLGINAQEHAGTLSYDLCIRPRHVYTALTEAFAMCVNNGSGTDDNADGNLCGAIGEFEAAEMVANISTYADRNEQWCASSLNIFNNMYSAVLAPCVAVMLGVLLWALHIRRQAAKKQAQREADEQLAEQQQREQAAALSQAGESNHTIKGRAPLSPSMGPTQASTPASDPKFKYGATEDRSAVSSLAAPRSAAAFGHHPNAVAAGASGPSPEEVREKVTQWIGASFWEFTARSADGILSRSDAERTPCPYFVPDQKRLVRWVLDAYDAIDPAEIAVAANLGDEAWMPLRRALRATHRRTFQGYHVWLSLGVDGREGIDRRPDLNTSSHLEDADELALYAIVQTWCGTIKHSAEKASEIFYFMHRFYKEVWTTSTQFQLQRGGGSSAAHLGEQQQQQPPATTAAATASRLPVERARDWRVEQLHRGLAEIAQVFYAKINACRYTFCDLNLDSREFARRCGDKSTHDKVDNAFNAFRARLKHEESLAERRFHPHQQQQQQTSSSSSKSAQPNAAAAATTTAVGVRPPKGAMTPENVLAYGMATQNREAENSEETVEGVIARGFFDVHSAAFDRKRWPAEEVTFPHRGGVLSPFAVFSWAVRLVGWMFLLAWFMLPTSIATPMCTCDKVRRLALCDVTWQLASALLHCRSKLHSLLYIKHNLRSEKKVLVELVMNIVWFVAVWAYELSPETERDRTADGSLPWGLHWTPYVAYLLYTGVVTTIWEAHLLVFVSTPFGIPGRLHRDQDVKRIRAAAYAAAAVAGGFVMLLYVPLFEGGSEHAIDLLVESFDSDRHWRDAIQALWWLLALLCPSFGALAAGRVAAKMTGGDNVSQRDFLRREANHIFFTIVFWGIWLMASALVLFFLVVPQISEIDFDLCKCPDWMETFDEAQDKQCKPPSQAACGLGVIVLWLSCALVLFIMLFGVYQVLLLVFGVIRGKQVRVGNVAKWRDVSECFEQVHEECLARVSYALVVEPGAAAGYWNSFIASLYDDFLITAAEKKRMTWHVPSGNADEGEEEERLPDFHDRPESSEAQRRILTYLWSLQSLHTHDTVGAARGAHTEHRALHRVRTMPSLTTNIPHYSETILFDLEELTTSADPERPRGRLPVIDYLAAMYEDEWRNFAQRMYDEDLERLKTKEKNKSSNSTATAPTTPGWSASRAKAAFDLVKAVHAAATCGGPAPSADEEGERAAGFLTASLVFEVRWWASMRGQTLARTLQGLWNWRRSLVWLLRVEEPHLSDWECEKLVAEKFMTTVTHQTGWHDRDLLSKPVGGEGQLGPRNALEQLEMCWVRLDGAFSVVFNDDATHTSHHRAPKFEYLYGATASDFAAAKARREQHKKAMHATTKRITVLPSKSLQRLDYAGTENAFYPETEAFTHEVVQRVWKLKVGEGKAENQMGALPFLRGSVIQAFDMNMYATWENGTRVPFLLHDYFHCPDTERDPSPPYRIVGYREHCYTSKLSAVGQFMGAGEYCFVTITQRTLSWPLRIRLHYGHPDFFDAYWVYTRGGQSKASLTVNMSEDVFAGYEVVGRGEAGAFVEFIEAEKGRESSFVAATQFESKISGGAASSLRSLDLYYISRRANIFTRLAIGFSSLAFYVANFLMAVSVRYYLFAINLFALSGTTYHQLGLLNGVIAVPWLFQVGYILGLPLLVETAIERGIRNGIKRFLYVFLVGSFFYVFQLRTKQHYFGLGLQVGKANYVATGRGFGLTHDPFRLIYRVFSASHFNEAMVLFALLILYAVYTTDSFATYVVRTWVLWFLVFAWLWAPLVFVGAPDFESVHLDARRMVSWMSAESATLRTLKAAAANAAASGKKGGSAAFDAFFKRLKAAHATQKASLYRRLDDEIELQQRLAAAMPSANAATCADTTLRLDVTGGVDGPSSAAAGGESVAAGDAADDIDVASTTLNFTPNAGDDAEKDVRVQEDLHHRLVELLQAAEGADDAVVSIAPATVPRPGGGVGVSAATKTKQSKEPEERINFARLRVRRALVKLAQVESDHAQTLTRDAFLALGGAAAGGANTATPPGSYDAAMNPLWAGHDLSWRGWWFKNLLLFQWENEDLYLPGILNLAPFKAFIAFETYVPWLVMAAVHFEMTSVFFLVPVVLGLLLSRLVRWGFRSRMDLVTIARALWLIPAVASLVFLAYNDRVTTGGAFWTLAVVLLGCLLLLDFALGARNVGAKLALFWPTGDPHRSSFQAKQMNNNSSGSGSGIGGGRSDASYDDAAVRTATYVHNAVFQLADQQSRECRRLQLLEQRVSWVIGVAHKMRRTVAIVSLMFMIVGRVIAACFPGAVTTLNYSAAVSQAWHAVTRSRASAPPPPPTAPAAPAASARAAASSSLTAAGLSSRIPPSVGRSNAHLRSPGQGPTARPARVRTFEGALGLPPAASAFGGGGHSDARLHAAPPPAAVHPTNRQSRGGDSVTYALLDNRR